MKKYLHLKCTNCKRSVDKLVNLTHYQPDKCTITLGCEGRLQPLEYKSDSSISVAQKTGATDWYPRNTEIINNKKQVDIKLIDLQSGSLKQIVIAVPQEEPPEDAIYTLSLKIKADTPKEYRQYIFRKSGVITSISGIESGLEKKALRFNAFGDSPDLVEVFVNGVKRDQGKGNLDYQIYIGDSASIAPPNTIVFNTPIEQPGISQIDIIISKDAPAKIINLHFTRNQYDESQVNTGAYENINYLERFINGKWQKYYLYTLDLNEGIIDLNSILLPVRESDAFILLARKPYTKLDRYNTIIFKLNNLNDNDYLKYFKENNNTVLKAADTSLVSVFPPLRFNKFTTESTIKTKLAGDSEQLVIDGSVIIGPDA
jgi:hypothetical protein